MPGARYWYVIYWYGILARGVCCSCWCRILVLYYVYVSPYFAIHFQASKNISNARKSCVFSYFPAAWLPFSRDTPTYVYRGHKKLTPPLSLPGAVDIRTELSGPNSEVGHRVSNDGYRISNEHRVGYDSDKQKTKTMCMPGITISTFDTYVPT